MASFDQSSFSKSLNPTTGMTDIFQNVGGKQTYIDAPTGKGLFAQGLNADQLPTIDHPGALKGPADVNTNVPNTNSLSIAAGDLAKGAGAPATFGDLTKSALGTLQGNDIVSKLQGYINQQPELAQNVATATKMSPEELDTAKKLLGITQDLTAEQQAVLERGIGGGLPMFTGAANREITDINNGLTPSSLQNTRQKTFLTQYLTLLQGSRTQQLDAAKYLYDANRNNITDVLNVYKETAPQNIATNVNAQTGDVYVTTRNPVTGEITNTKAGNIGPTQSYQNTQVITDPNTGQLVFVGTKPDGSLDVQPLTNYNTPGQYGSSGAPTGFSDANGKKIVAGYDLTSYATDPDYASKVNAIYSTVGKINSANDANAMIQKLNPGSPITGQMIMTAAQQYGVDPQLMIAQMKLESQLGTAGAGAKTFNPGNVGNTDNGSTRNMGSWQAGVNAMAANLAGRKQASGGTPTGTITPEIIQQTVQSLPPALQGAVRYLADGTPYLSGSQLTADQQKMAQTLGTAKGIPFINSDSATKLDTISVTQKNLEDFKKLADSTLAKNGASGFLSGTVLNPNSIGLRLSSLFGGTTKANFDSFRTAAINAIQGLGSGGGFRLTQGEINTAVDNLPTISDTAGQAQTKVQALNKQMNNWIEQIVPGWVPPTTGAGSSGGAAGIDYTQTLDKIANGK